MIRDLCVGMLDSHVKTVVSFVRGQQATYEPKFWPRGRGSSRKIGEHRPGFDRVGFDSVLGGLMKAATNNNSDLMITIISTYFLET